MHMQYLSCYEYNTHVNGTIKRKERNWVTNRPLVVFRARIGGTANHTIFTAEELHIIIPFNGLCHDSVVAQVDKGKYLL